MGAKKGTTMLFKKFLHNKRDTMEFDDEVLYM